MFDSALLICYSQHENIGNVILFFLLGPLVCLVVAKQQCNFDFHIISALIPSALLNHTESRKIIVANKFKTNVSQ